MRGCSRPPLPPRCWGAHAFGAQVVPPAVFGWRPDMTGAMWTRCPGMPPEPLARLPRLIARLISARTLDETTIPVCHRLFARARTPAAVAVLDHAKLAALLHGATFPEPKARDILALSRAILEQFGGAVPDMAEGLIAFRGVGPKVAALTLAVGFNRPAICVDIHVHRVTNRWGYVAAPTPERTLAALAGELPGEFWIEINERLVPFGKHVCTGPRPKCLACPLLSMCRQVGVGRAAPAQ